MTIPNWREWLGSAALIFGVLLTMYVLIAWGARITDKVIRWFVARDRRLNGHQWDAFDREIKEERDELARNRKAAIRAWYHE